MWTNLYTLPFQCILSHSLCVSISCSSSNLIWLWKSRDDEDERRRRNGIGMKRLRSRAQKKLLMFSFHFSSFESEVNEMTTTWQHFFFSPVERSENISVVWSVQNDSDLLLKNWIVVCAWSVGLTFSFATKTWYASHYF